MTKKIKGLFLIGGLLILVGLTISLIVLINNKFDFSKFDNSSYISNTHELNDSFSDIVINSNTADIEFIYSLDGLNKVECFESEKEIHSVTVSNNKLEINVTNNRKWYDYIGFNFKTPKIKIYLNQFLYNSLVITEDTGNINIPDEFNFTSINIKASTGNVTCSADTLELTKIDLSTGNVLLNHVQSKNIEINTSTGDINLSNIVSSNMTLNLSTGNTILNNINTDNLVTSASTGDIIFNNVIGIKFMIERSTGDVTFNKSDADEIYIKTDTGDITGTLLSNKIFKYDSDTGDVKLPSVMNGGKCQIETDTGDIEISIVE